MNIPCLDQQIICKFSDSVVVLRARCSRTQKMMPRMSTKIERQTFWKAVSVFDPTRVIYLCLWCHSVNVHESTRYLSTNEFNISSNNNKSLVFLVKHTVHDVIFVAQLHRLPLCQWLLWTVLFRWFFFHSRKYKIKCNQNAMSSISNILASVGRIYKISNDHNFISSEPAAEKCELTGTYCS